MSAFSKWPELFNMPKTTALADFTKLIEFLESNCGFWNVQSIASPTDFWSALLLGK